MQLKIEECHDCGYEKPIINRRHGLCSDCNYRRLHGESKFEKSIKKLFGKSHSIQSIKYDKSTTSNEINSFRKNKRKSIKKISDKKKYYCSDGTRLSQIEINRALSEVKDRLQYEREPFCAATGSSEYPLSWSHTISVARCKELRKCELILDPDNLHLEGHHERCSNPKAGHSIWEDGTWDQKLQLLNINQKLQYIKTHDPETFRKLPQKVKDKIK